MERNANIAFMVLLLIPVAVFFGIQNLLLIREMNLINRKKKPRQPMAEERTPAAKSPVAKSPAAKKKVHRFQVVKGRSQDRKKALFR
ncbi:hypothetical protein [Anoxynatronum buryatiense]|uniref:Uncharacterized protein n=1 Tax=Anoxynatronum buryatiense TaxID=489973 RepID=A0AA45WW05_9CLOT|nr:hypothetical protein [Anoxynatronum buryatiense]SMP56449.1 hypothetical protein SAMN06296020_10668 [Anoxynatronum buryatiense]